MKNSTQCRTQLTVLLEAHTARISAANEYLLKIKNAIAENKLETLEQTLTSSELPFSDIEKLEQQRHQLLTEYGFSKDSDGFKKCVDWCDGGAGQVSNLYKMLIQCLVELQNSIQINSLLVSKGRDRVRRSIGILTGSGRAASYRTYTSNGKAEQRIGQRDIAVA